MKPRRQFILILVLCALLFTNGRGTEADKIPVIAKQVVDALQVEYPKWFEKRDLPGAALIIVDEKDILHQATFGYTSRKKEREITPETVFSIQSMSKSFTALGVLMAVQDGLLDLDAPITDYLPEFMVNSPFEKNPEKKMTLRKLLSHRAGFTHEAPVGSNFDSRPHSFEEHILSIPATWLRYPVDYRYSYSNLGIDLAGYILSKKTGKPFWDYIQERVLDPIGMRQSSMNFEKIKQIENRAIGHVAKDQKVEGGIPVVVPMIPAGGTYTNILDMAKYLQFHMNKGRANGKQLLKRELIEEMQAVAFPEKNQRAGYGLGIGRSLVSRIYGIYHGGGGYGFISYMLIYPELKLGIVTLSNASNGISGSLIHSVVDPIIEKELGATKPWPESTPVENYTRLSDDDLRVKSLIGFYDPGIRIQIRDKVFGIQIQKNFYPLEMYTDERGKIVGKFGKYSELRVKPPRGGQRGTLIHLNRFSGTINYYDFRRPEKSEEKKGPDKPEWKKYTGVYRMLAWGRMRGSQIIIAIRNGHLTLNGDPGREHLPGLFFTYNGEALDFRGTVPTYRNILLIKTR